MGVLGLERRLLVSGEEARLGNLLGLSLLEQSELVRSANIEKLGGERAGLQRLMADHLNDEVFYTFLALADRYRVNFLKGNQVIFRRERRDEQARVLGLERIPKQLEITVPSVYGVSVGLKAFQLSHLYLEFPVTGQWRPLLDVDWILDRNLKVALIQRQHTIVH